MTPKEFIDKWRQVELNERTASQSHLNDLCQFLRACQRADKTIGRFGVYDELGASTA